MTSTASLLMIDNGVSRKLVLGRRIFSSSPQLILHPLAFPQAAKQQSAPFQLLMAVITRILRSQRTGNCICHVSGPLLAEESQCRVALTQGDFVTRISRWAN